MSKGALDSRKESSYRTKSTGFSQYKRNKTKAKFAAGALSSHNYERFPTHLRPLTSLHLLLFKQLVFYT